MSPSSGITPRGSGDHHPKVFLRSGIGKIPLRYAASNVPGSRSAPIPQRPLSSANSGDGRRQRLGGGSIGGRPMCITTDWNTSTDSVGVETALGLATEVASRNLVEQGLRGR